MNKNSEGNAPSQPDGIDLGRVKRRSIRHIGSLIDRYVLGTSPFISPPEEEEDSYASEVEYRDEDRLVYLGKWFIQMRWLVCIVSVVLIIVTVEVFKYLEKSALLPLLALVGCLVAANVMFSAFWRRRWFVEYIREIQIGVDLVIFTAMLHYSGGIENPLCFAYLFHIIIAGILFDRRKCYLVVGAASVLFGGLAFAEMVGLFEHSTLLLFPHPSHTGDEHGLLHVAHQPVYVFGTVMVQIILMSLTAYFTTSIMGRLRSEERRTLAERQRLDRVLQATGAGLLILDRDLRPVWLNDQIRIWLYAFEDGTERSLGRLGQWTGGEDSLVAETFRDGTARVVERQLTDFLGNTSFFQVIIAPLTDSDGNVYQVAELTQDITERKAVEAEMVHAGKMAVLGVMAAGIAHEVGNPLASISTRLRLLEEIHDEAFLKESLRLLQGQIDRIGRIVHGVSQFARPARHEWTACRINTVAAEALNVLRLHRLAKSSEIHSELDAGLPETMAVKDQLMHVFVNLGLNALEAMPGGGTLTVKTYARDGRICIEFADVGEGMTEEISSKIFGPFFSTKDTGSGLGLWIVHNIVHSHGGRIDVRSIPGRGSSFTVSLPIRTAAQLHHEGMRVSTQ